MRKLVVFVGAAALLAGLTIAYSAQAEKSCQYAGQTYSHGAELCMNHFTYVCNDGTWHPRGPQC